MDEDFLNQIDQGYIGYTAPQVDYSVDKGKDLWVLEDGKLIRRYVPAEELKDYSPAERDNDPASPEQAGW